MTHVPREAYPSQYPKSQIAQPPAHVVANSKLLPSHDYSAFVAESSLVLDCGMGTRDQFSRIVTRAHSVDTLDYTTYESYPTIIFDLTDSNLPERLFNRFDVIFCISILEHVTKPQVAAEHLMSMLRPGGKLIGYVPWLFPYHSGQGMGKNEYEDYWRFSPSALTLLFSGAKNIEIFPVRGRLSTALMLALFQGGRNWWKALESRLPQVFRVVNLLFRRGSNRWQSSGYEFVIQK